MTKNFTIATGKDSENAVRVARTAAILELSERYVRMVLAGERKSDLVMAVYMELAEGETQLVKQVKQLVPIN
jgi:hypothetical protein